MAMIISDDIKFVYMHIPKCAGTTLSKAMKAAMPHDERFLGAKRDKETGQFLYMEHPVLGKLNAPHIPLALLREHFPDVWTKLQTYNVYAITRDPAARFQSAIGQIVKEFMTENIFSIPESRLRKIVRDCISGIRKNPVHPGVEYMHLIRQADFIELNGEQIAKNVYPIDAVSQMVKDINARFNVEVDAGERQNQARIPAFAGANSALWWMGRAARTALPMDTYFKLKNGAARLLTSDARQKPDLTFFRSAEVTDFVQEFYARDYELYDETKKAFAQVLIPPRQPDKEHENAH
ncbi:MAG: sulfotransferase family 2 domain-containing protein [Paracoccaceae bacterium]